MKKVIMLFAVASAVILSSFAKFADDTFTVDGEKSSITWTGRKVTGSHKGTIKLSNGSLVFSGKNLKSGNFAIDMKTLESPDGARLVGHLKNPDFFDVEKFPTATLAITKVTPAAAGEVTISGNLTIKGATNPISFPATIARDGNTVTATAKSIKVDRSKYDVRYGSKSFFADIGDKAIEDEFELGVTLVATRK